MEEFADSREGAIIDTLAAQLDPKLAFLRARWFSSGTDAIKVAIAHDQLGVPLAAFPLADMRKGPFALRQIGGGYWPLRSLPIASDCHISSLAAAMACPDMKRVLGKVWRLGPVAADDPALATLIPAARQAGWQALHRSLGMLFTLNLADLNASGDWPSTKTKRKNRWRKRRLEEEGGALRTEFFTGADWTAAHRDAMAAVEASSWLGKRLDGGDTKFRDPVQRQFWEDLCDDPQLAKMLFGSVLWLGDTPAAFTFGVAAGDTRYYIANNYDDRFTSFGPGRVLLYDDFERAAQTGTAQVNWGLGDAGYKSEMGAQTGAELHDILFVRGRVLARLLRPLWDRG
ncbi:GNAT family N-acetyltransferase [Qipengyuania marisflavi]|uniref:GNAT family N-acetyltransferase n=1 Tax=Qipengyuania marisflavi TaxID=2486356 RepID=A0A5S3P7C1_9SPHN|nr:GNAT family N-acetyltransferase [Qipengyuania marisflavi]TMM48922.1 GNAT family N-acetyltransferase [Qipengyuania marisflavi]